MVNLGSIPSCALNVWQAHSCQSFNDLIKNVLTLTKSVNSQLCAGWFYKTDRPAINDTKVFIINH
jgi:hypothetical protein